MLKYYIYVIISGLLSGTIIFSGKLFSTMGLSLFEISMLTSIIIAGLLTPFVIFSKKYKIKKGNLKNWILFGFIAACLYLTQFAAVVLGVSVALTVLLLYTQPLWTIIFSKVFLKEKIEKSQIIACILVLLGLLVLVNPFTIDEINLTGLICALSAGIFLSAWITIGSYISKTKNNPLTMKFNETFFTIIFLALFYPLILLFTTESSIVNFSLNQPITIWIYITLFAIFTGIINHICYFKGVQKVPTVDAGIIMLLEPVSGALLASIFLNEPITLNLLIGGAIILFSNYFIITKNVK